MYDADADADADAGADADADADAYRAYAAGNRTLDTRGRPLDLIKSNQIGPPQPPSAGGHPLSDLRDHLCSLKRRSSRIAYHHNGNNMRTPRYQIIGALPSCTE
ncbi:hypothetical protein MMC29_006498 [Sticta canariensis]|nr:hypothetical protein [Sticta canariensis]